MLAYQKITSLEKTENISHIFTISNKCDNELDCIDRVFMTTL